MTAIRARRAQERCRVRDDELEHSVHEAEFPAGFNDQGDAYALSARRQIPDYRRVLGNIAAYVLQRDCGDIVEFETRWVSEAAVERYAGGQILRAKHYDFDPTFLLEFEEFVTHYRSAFGFHA